MVYVDEARNWPAAAIKTGARGRGRRWCHMWADSDAELHALAEAIGLQRAWAQEHRLMLHYDLTENKRAAAIRAGAVPGDLRSTMREILATRRTIREQLRHVMSTPRQVNVPCGCGRNVELWKMFRCYYCGQFFCRECAPGHFGKVADKAALNDEAQLYAEVDAARRLVLAKGGA